VKLHVALQATKMLAEAIDKDRISEYFLEGERMFFPLSQSWSSSPFVHSPQILRLPKLACSLLL
jgi:hypothetical protein